MTDKKTITIHGEIDDYTATVDHILADDIGNTIGNAVIAEGLFKGAHYCFWFEPGATEGYVRPVSADTGEPFPNCTKCPATRAWTEEA